jgi:hypothetical protein
MASAGSSRRAAKARLAAGQWQRHQVVTVDVEQVKDEIDKIAPASPIGGVLDQSEERDASGRTPQSQINLPD